MEMNSQILKWLEEFCPDKAPKYQLSDYEQGVIVGQRQLIEHLKIKLKVLTDKEEIK